MSVLISSLKEELDTSRRLEKQYLAKLLELPQGSFHVRKVKDRFYAYLTKRKNGQVIQDYLGPMDSKEIAEYRKKFEKKKIWKEQLKKVKEQIKILERVVKRRKAK